MSLPSWSPNPEVVTALVGLLSSTVDPFANHQDVYNQIQHLQGRLGGDFDLYLVFLLNQWTNPDLRVEVCQAAGLLLKQSIKRRDALRGQEYGATGEKEALVKTALSSMFLATAATAATAAAESAVARQQKKSIVHKTLGTVITTIVGMDGFIGWPDLASKIFSQLQTDHGTHHGTDALAWDHLEETLDLVLKVLEDHGRASKGKVSEEVVHLCAQHDLGNLVLLKASAPLTKVRAKALRCVYHILQILHLRGTKEASVQRGLPQNTLTRLLALTSAPEAEVKALVCAGFAHILEVREAQLLQAQLENLVRYMAIMSQEADTAVALEATGFWSVYLDTIAYYSAEGGEAFAKDCEYWLHLGLSDLIRVLAKNMMYAAEDDDVIEAEQVWEDLREKGPLPQGASASDVRPFQLRPVRGIEAEEAGDEVVEQWTLRKCSARTLDHLALHFGDALLPFLMPIVIERLQEEAWLVKESAILALGAVITGCPGLEQHTLDVTKVVLPLLQHQQDTHHPLLLTICCWTLSRFASALVQVSSQAGDAGRDLFGQAHASLLNQMRSFHPKVLESATSAVAVCVQVAPTPLLLQVLDPTIEGIRSALGRREAVSDRNLILVYDLVGTLCASMQDSQAPEILHDARYLALLLEPLVSNLFSHPRDKYGDQVYLNLVQTLSACAPCFGPSFDPQCAQMISFCVQACTSVVARGEGSDKAVYTVSASFGLLAALAHLPSFLSSLVTHEGFVGFVRESLASASPDVKQAAFSLCGSILSIPGTDERLLGMEVGKSVIKTGVASLQGAAAAGATGWDDQDQAEDDGNEGLAGPEVDEANNALWCLSKVTHLMDAPCASAVLGLASPFLDRTAGHPRMVVENATILIGALSCSHAAALGPHADHFFWSWAVALGTLCDSREKETAFAGLFHLLQARQEMGVKHFPQVCNAIASWYKIKNPTVREVMAQMLLYFRDHVDWTRVPNATKNKLNSEYKLNLPV